MPGAAEGTRRRVCAHARRERPGQRRGREGHGARNVHGVQAREQPDRGVGRAAPRGRLRRRAAATGRPLN